MTTRTRGEVIGHTDVVVLQATFRGTDGVIANLDSFPNVTIIQPSGNVALGPTSSGVARVSTGVYEYRYTVGINDSIGVWVDVWEGVLSGNTIVKDLNFVIHDTQLPHINSDGYVALGDDPGFNYSQNAISNINNLLKALKARLNSSGKKKDRDSYGNVIYVDCDAFSVDMLVTFLVDSLSLFNEIPHFTTYTFEDSDFINQFFNIIVQGATILALASKQLIEKGREFNVTDNGVSFQPPTISEVMGSQYSAELTNYTEKLKIIKSSMKPSPLGLSSYAGLGSGTRGVIRALLLRRARQII